MPRKARNTTRSTDQRFYAWRKQYHNAKMVRQAQAIPLCQDMVTLLTFVRDNKVVGTQSTGNMPLKAVREVTARFVKPPELDTTIGDHTYRLRTEADVWSLYFLHILAEVGGLLAIAPARRWRLTPQGEGFLGMDPLLQISYLLTIWWYEVNWLVAYPFEGMGDALPPDFNLTTLGHLHSLPTETHVPFEKFADKLIEKTGLTWTAQDSSAAGMLLRSSIARMVIYILAAFGAIEYKTRQDPLGKGTITKLDAFKITPLGKALLDSVAIMSG